MTFSSLPFLLFLPIVLIGLHFIKNKNKQHIFLLLASYFFYGWWDVRFLLLMIGETALCWILALWMEKDKRHDRLICGAGSVLLLLILGVFKYFNFFTENLSILFGQEIGTLSVILPIGISFYTFQGISYLVDVKRGTVKAERSFVQISLYISFFAQLVAGPIVRSSEFLPQLENPVYITKANLYEGAQIFLFGFIKKKVFADRLGSFVTAVYALPGAYNTLTLWLAVLAYAVQIYFDFSGYSDMAIGTAKMMGYTLMRNFNAPFLARNPSEFWRRWHISLSGWLRDYLYIPLGGNRKGFARTCLNLMITMLLGGLWHGASWNFVIWGGLHGASQVIHKIFRNVVPKKENALKNLLSTLVTAVFAALVFIFFRCEQLSDALTVLKGLFIFQGGIHYPYVYAVIGVAITVIGHILAHLHKREGYYPLIRRNDFWGVFLFVLAVLLSAVLAYNGEAPFIYFQF